ncbi:hypothetical protein BKA70DRAFT_1422717 [Coprinopsis sp. MPI-PUGE-AT-0042]|nr:hypothetical protein BKA70DRAFT_1422717 [Coprinopsis sp. MPI-PUGE-AT-0042]
MEPEEPVNQGPVPEKPKPRVRKPWKQVFPDGRVVEWPPLNPSEWWPPGTKRPRDRLGEYLTVHLDHTVKIGSGERIPIQDLMPNYPPVARTNSGSATTPSSPALQPAASGSSSAKALEESGSDSSLDSNPDTYYRPKDGFDNPMVLYVPLENLVDDPTAILPDPPEGFDIPDLTAIFEVPDIVQDFYDYLTLSGRAYGLVETSRRLRNGDFLVTLSDKYTVKDDDGTPESVAFCKATAMHPFRLGLGCIEVGLLSSRHLLARENALRNQLATGNPRLAAILSLEELDAAWKKAGSYISDSLEGRFDAENEASARVLIDPFLTCLKRLPGSGASQTLVYPESVLSEKIDDEAAAKAKSAFENPTYLHYEEDGFTVSGRVDYLVFALEEAITPEERKKYGKVRGLDQALEELGVLDSKDIGLLVLEAKSLHETSSRELKKHIPQVVMEAYVCMKKSQYALNVEVALTELSLNTRGIFTAAWESLAGLREDFAVIP